MASSRSISREEFRARLEEATKLAIVPNEGLFGPRSFAWRLLKDSVGFLGGGRAALLQTAHPWVANAVAQHSKTKTDPIGRFHRTFENVFTIIFGSLDQVIAVSEGLNRIHSGIVGRIPDPTARYDAGSRYFANQLDAMLWVHATLWDTAIRMHELVYGPLDRGTKEAFYREIRRFALCFGVPFEAQPPTWHEFMEYNARTWDSNELGVGPAALEIRGYLFRSKLFPGARLPLSFVEIFTAEHLPPRLRDAFRMPPPTIANKAVYHAGLATIRATHPRLPDHLRYVPAYVEAMDRIAGKPRSGLVTRKLSKLYTGREELVSRDAWLGTT